jgi:hypothetical protein
MAAGLGFKTFTTGEVLTSADTNGYLMQGILVFADAAARDAAITSPQEGQFAYLKDTDVTTYYTSSAWANLDTTGMTNPMTTTADMIYSSSGSTPARLGIGTAGQVLTVNGGATAPEWATPAGGSSGLTLISRQTASAAATVSFDGAFTSTYQAYILIIEDLLSSSAFNLDMTLKYSTNTEQTTGYYGSSFNGSTETTTTNGSEFRMSQGGISSDAGEFSNMHILFSPMNKSGRGVVSGFGAAGKTTKPISFMGVSTETRTYTGCKFFLSAGNMTGTFSMYGLAKS